MAITTLAPLSAAIKHLAEQRWQADEIGHSLSAKSIRQGNISEDEAQVLEAALPQCPPMLYISDMEK